MANGAMDTPGPIGHEVCAKPGGVWCWKLIVNSDELLARVVDVG